jgi:pyruvate-formate lyase-activating enzyme
MNKYVSNSKSGPIESCTYCHNPRHIKEKCFKLIGYRPGWKDRKKESRGSGNSTEVRRI